MSAVPSNRIYSRHLIMGGCNPAQPHSYWGQVTPVLVESFRATGTPFDTIDCPLNKAEEQAAVERIVSSLPPLDPTTPILIVASAIDVEHGNCHPSAEAASVATLECPTDTSPFQSFAASLALNTSAVHLWIEDQPDVADFGQTAETSTSLRLIPNNLDGGRVMGVEYCSRTAQYSGDQRIALMYGTPNSVHGNDRIRGFLRATRDQCPQHTVVAEVYGNFNRSTAKELANGLFLVDSALTTVVCASDDMALGVIEAAAETRWRGTSGLLVVGYDNLEEIRPHVVSGTVPVSIDQLTRESSSGLPYTLGLAARRLATLLLTGPLSSARVTADLKLSVTDPTTIRTAVLPFVTNVQQVRVVDLLVLPNASLPVARPHHLSRRALPAHSSQPPDSPTPRVARLPQYVLSKILDNYDTATVPYNEGQCPRLERGRRLRDIDPL